MLTHIRIKHLHIKVNNLTQEGLEEENRRWKLNIHNKEIDLDTHA